MIKKSRDADRIRIAGGDDRFLCCFIRRDQILYDTRVHRWLIAHQQKDCLNIRRVIGQSLHAAANRTADSALPVCVSDFYRIRVRQFRVNLFAVAPDYDHNRRTAGFTCCINDGANKRFAAKWEQLLWLPEPRRSARSQDDRACHPKQNHAESKDPAVSKSTFVRPVADNSSLLHARKSRARGSLQDGLIGTGFFATQPKCRKYPSLPAEYSVR